MKSKVKNQKSKILYLLPLLITGLPFVHAGEGKIAGMFLLDSLGGRAAALGNAGTALTGNLQSVGYNPSLVNTLHKRELYMQLQTTLGEVKTGALGYGQSGQWTGWAAQVVYMDAGTIHISLADGTQSSRDAQKDSVLSLSGGVSLAGVLDMGITVKQVSSKLVDAYSDNVIAGDAGVVLHMPVHGWIIGASVLNEGPELKYMTAKDPLPRLYRFGTSYTFCRQGDVKTLASIPWKAQDMEKISVFTFTADAVRDREGEMLYGTGVEWFYWPKAALRLGYQFGIPSEGFTFGFGLNLPAGYIIDYSMKMIDNLSDQHKVSLSFFWD